MLIIFMPVSRQLTYLTTTKKQGVMGESIAGYADYRRMKTGESISDYYPEKTKLYNTVPAADGKLKKTPLRPEQVAFRAKVMVGVLVVAALFWATGAIAIGVTALLVGVLMYFFGILPADQVASAFAKDSVVFIFGVLAVAAAISKTGLDRRIGMLLLGTSTTLRRFGLVFAPLLAVTASFLSEHALVAFIAPILMLAYMGAIKTAWFKKDKYLVVMMLLMLSFCGNIGGPGSPAAGGRNAVMLGIFADYGVQLSFGQWVKLGLPFVPVMALVIGGYFLVAFRGKVRVPSVNMSAEVRRESEKIGKMTPDEYKAAAVLVLLIFLWVTLSSRFGMGGPVLLCLVLLNVLGYCVGGISIESIGMLLPCTLRPAPWDTDLAGHRCCPVAGLQPGDSPPPEVLKSGTGLLVSASLITGILTKFMSDGATVAAVGPVTVSMATLSCTSPLMVGLTHCLCLIFRPRTHHRNTQ